MDRHTPPHIHAPAPVDGVAVMPEPLARKYSSKRYTPKQFPFLCSDWFDDEFQRVVFGTPLHALEWDNTVAYHRRAVSLMDEAVGGYDTADDSYKALYTAWVHVHTWLRAQAAINASPSTVDRAYKFVALELQHAMRTLPAPLQTHDSFTALDVIRKLVTLPVVHATLNDKLVELNPDEDWDETIEKQSPLRRCHGPHIIRVDAKEWDDMFGRTRVQRNCQPPSPATPAPASIIPADQVTTTVAPDVQGALDKFVEVSPAQLSSQTPSDLTS